MPLHPLATAVRSYVTPVCRHQHDLQPYEAAVVPVTVNQFRSNFSSNHKLVGMEECLYGGKGSHNSTVSAW